MFPFHYIIQSAMNIHFDTNGLLVMLVMLILAVYYDVKHNKVPNILIVLGIVIGIAVNAYAQGMNGAIESASGIGVGLIMLLPFYILGGMGAGDVKLMASVGAYLGMAGTVVAVIFTLIAGGVIAFFVIGIHFLDDNSLAKYIKTINQRYFADKQSIAITDAKYNNRSYSLRFPYSLAIMLGALASVYESAIIY